MWELDCNESWVPKSWCFQTVVLEKTLESPLDCKEIKPVNPKRNQSWIFTGKTDDEAETPTLWPPNVENSETDGNTRPPDLPLKKPVCRFLKQQLELDMEQQTGSK